MTIVAAVDRDGPAESVVREGAKLADAFGAELHVIHVLGRSEFVSLERDSVEDTGEGVSPDEVRERARRVAVDIADEVDPDLQYVASGVVGNAAEEIVRYAREHDAEYIVVGGRKRSPVGKVLFGSVTQSVLLSAPCTVVSTMGVPPEE